MHQLVKDNMEPREKRIPVETKREHMSHLCQWEACCRTNMAKLYGVTSNSDFSIFSKKIEPYLIFMGDIYASKQAAV